MQLKDVSVYAIQAQMKSSGCYNNELSLIAWRQDKDNYVEVVMNEWYDYWEFIRWENGIVADYESRSSQIEPYFSYPVSIRLFQQQDGPILVASIWDHYLSISLPENAILGDKVGFRAQRTTGFFDSLRILGTKN